MKTETIYLLMDGVDPVISFRVRAIAELHAWKNGLTMHELELIIK